MNEKTETHEPLAAILAEMRASSLSTVRAWADRIEAAAKREYVEAKDYFAKLHDGPSMICTAKNCAVRNVGLSLAALSAPARNCDRFQTEDEAYAAFMGLFDHFKGERHYQYCKWLFAPAEGETK